MQDSNTHLSDEELVLLADGEAAARKEAVARRHLAACWPCRLRLREFEDAIAGFARLHRDSQAEPLPAPDGPRALLKARLRELAAAPPPRRPRHAIAYAATAAALLAVVLLTVSPSERDAIPRADLTPGAVRYIAASDVCSARLENNAEVVPAVQRQVFAEYGMPDAQTAAYEVDYLITPALGGSDDIRNLWPQPYSGSEWNAYVKDALEDRLRRMVCAGQLDLATAQHEIAGNWIAAYRKYFRTSRPLERHRRFRPEGE
jgi:hypothetical protein